MNRKIFSIAFSVAALVLLGIEYFTSYSHDIVKFMRWIIVIACIFNIYNFWQYKNSWKRILIIPLFFIALHYIYGKGFHAEWLNYDKGTMVVLVICLFVT